MSRYDLYFFKYFVSYDLFTDKKLVNLKIPTGNTYRQHDFFKVAFDG